MPTTQPKSMEIPCPGRPRSADHSPRQRNQAMKTSPDTNLPLLFYGVPSGCSFGSIVALEWLGQPYQLSRIEMPDVVSSDDFKRINPVGETPTLRTAAGDFISESVAILNHIGALDLDRQLTFA